MVTELPAQDAPPVGAQADYLKPVLLNKMHVGIRGDDLESLHPSCHVP